MRIGAFDLLAPPAGNYFLLFMLFRYSVTVLPLVPHRNTGLPNLQESYVGTLFPRSVHNGPSSPIYTLYIHTVCVYSRVFFPIFWIFYGFYGFFGIFTVFIGFFTFILVFPFCFYSAYSKKKEWGVQFSHFPISDKFSITNKCIR